VFDARVGSHGRVGVARGVGAECSAVSCPTTHMNE
jgi:hypothetical protein